MTERRARGTSPVGRGDRRPSRSAKSRPAAGPKRADGSRTAASKRAAKRRPAKSVRSERTILGLSTGRAILLAAVVCALALTLAVPLRTYFSQRSEAQQLAAERSQLEDELSRLRDRRAQQEDPNYIKTEARDRLSLVMPGETPYIVQVPGIEQPAVPAQTAKPREPDPWYTELWRSISEPPPAPIPAATPAPPPPGPAPAPIEEGAPR
ncbi:septum formation initiator family protein [Nocardia uniformis]|uniref:Septum formation initiator family protein n=1 Tax=Nocardia uniformis TaxID=53432 RepID=A0A849BXU0_9NOCA|nr:septum formation initiator family protein [Nocardia uniformis]NNH70048.1 septum formation initiator family protein [Nocardia uniformis]